MGMNEELIFEDEFEDEFEEGSDNPGEIKNNNEGDNNQQDNQQDDLTLDVLRLKGIQDPTKIKFEDESGAIIERSWDSLSRDEQLNILVDNTDQDNSLYEDEIELINSIRNSGMNVQDYLNSLNSTPQEKTYKVDQLSDEDLYALDLLEKVGSDNISDEELTQAIEAAKQNEALFKKTVEGLRNEYKRLQEDEENQLIKEQELKNQKEYTEFQNSIQNEIKNLNQFIGKPLELSNEDIEELADFILQLDDNGLSSFGKAMNDPSLFTRAAFWILNENKIAEEIDKQIQESYKRGYNQAKQDVNNSNSSKLVITTNQKNSTKNQEFIDDDEWD